MVGEDRKRNPEEEFVHGCRLGIALGFELLVWGLLSWRKAY